MFKDPCSRWWNKPQSKGLIAFNGWNEILDVEWKVCKKWSKVSRWVLVKVLIKLWPVVGIDFLLDCTASLEMTVHNVQHCGKAIKLQSFLLLQFLRLTDNSSVWAPINTTQTSSLCHRIIFLSSTLIGMNSSVWKVHALDCENVNQPLWTAKSFYEASHISVWLRRGAKGQTLRSTWKEHRCTAGLEEPGLREQTWSGGLPKLPPSIWRSWVWL